MVVVEIAKCVAGSHIQFSGKLSGQAATSRSIVMAYSSRSVTSCSADAERGRKSADLARHRKSAMLIVTLVRRAAAFWGSVLKMAASWSGHRWKAWPSSMALSTSWVRTAKSRPMASGDVQFAGPRCFTSAAAPALWVDIIEIGVCGL